MSTTNFQQLLDPSQVSRRPRLDPLRCYVSLRRLIEPRWYRRLWQSDPWAQFSRSDAPGLQIDCSDEEVSLLGRLEKIPSAVTAEQATVLYSAARQSRGVGDIVEIGSDQGKSTVILAWAANRSGAPCEVQAVDPFLSGAEMTSTQRAELLSSNLAQHKVDNVIVHVMTSGEYRRERQTPVRFLFVDAAHDYLNSRFDFMAWKTLIAPGGFIAAHDVDNYTHGPGTRKAFVDCVLKDAQFRLIHHMDNLAVAQRIIADANTRH
jgi:predicted O-methyltransferase YrrM